MSSDPREAKSDIIILLGQTGGGKSSIGNAILNKPGIFNESSSLKSETDEIKVISGNWYGNRTPVTVIDTPGFLDSENRGSKFMTGIIKTLASFPKDKLKLVIITLPLSDTRANSTYKTTITEIELLLGEEFLDHTVFVTTLSNQVSDKNLANSRMNEWQEWLKTHANLPENKIQTCNFEYGNPLSLETVHECFNKFTTFTPETSAKMKLYLEANPHATVDELIEHTENLRKLREDHEKRIKELVDQKNESIKRLEQQEKLSARLSKALDEDRKTVQRLQEELKNRPKETIREIHHHTESGCLIQ